MSKIKNNNFLWNMIGTSFNAFTSLFLMIIITRINGINDAGVFTYAFSIACLFYIIGVYSGRTYQITENNDNFTNTEYFYLKIISCFVMLVVGILFIFINHFNFYKSMILFVLIIFKLLEAFSEYSYAVIQSKNELYKVGKSLFYKFILGISLFVLIDYITKNLLLSLIPLVVANIIFIYLYDLKSINKYNFKIEKFNKQKILLLLKNGFYAFGFSFLTIFVINVQKYVMGRLLTDDLQAIYGIIIMPATVFALFGQFMIQPYLVKLKELLNLDLIGFRKLVKNLLFVFFIIGLVVLIIAYFLGIPVLNILYNLNLNIYLVDFIIILVGAILYGISLIISTALTTMRKTFVQLIIYFITSIFSYFISIKLMKMYEIRGAAWAYLLTMLLLAILYIIIYIYMIRKKVKSNERCYSNSSSV